MDIVKLITDNNLTPLANDLQSNLIDKLQNHFNTDDQQLFLGSFYCYLNYNKENDYIIELNNVWKWLGFARIDHYKRVLYKHFTENVDYKIIYGRDEKPAPQVGGAGFKDHKIDNSEKDNYVNFAPQLGEAKIEETRGGYNKETILLNIKTFKKLCLKSNTKKADEIHDYFIKLRTFVNKIY